MADSNLKMEVRYPAAGVSLIDIEGDLTGTAEEVMMAAYDKADRNGTKSIILNFTDLDYMNSSGIGLLVTMLIRIQRQKQSLRAFGLSEHYRQIFNLTRLDEAITLYESETAAISAS